MRRATLLSTIALAGLASAASAKPGDRYFIDPAHLPRPFQTSSVLRIPHITAKPAGGWLSAPKGFHISVLAEGFNNPRWMTILPNGDIIRVESRVEIGPNIFPKRLWLLRPQAHGMAKKYLLTKDRDLP